MLRRRTMQLLAAALILGALGRWVATAAAPSGQPPAAATPNAAAPTAAPATTSAPAATPSPTPEATSGPATPQPPDGKWLTDKDGRKYFLTKIKKAKGRYIQLDDHHIRASYGVTIEIEKQDDEYYYVRVNQETALAGTCPGLWSAPRCWVRWRVR
jgi:pyruvate/2-oxoglutarate dehydrogenase complex dihydrolipoamide acyltransferase (E2) component